MYFPLLAAAGAAIGLLVSTPVSAYKDDGDELYCMVQNIYHEARGEPAGQQAAVAHVTMNRVQSTRYPNTVCDVVWQPHQFSWTGDGHSDAMTDLDAIQLAVDVALSVMRGRNYDPTDGMLHYYAHNKIKAPKWAKNPERVAVLGNHTFLEVN